MNDMLKEISHPGSADALRKALEEMRDRDDRNGSLPLWYRERIDAALSATANESEVGIDDAEFGMSDHRARLSADAALSKGQYGWVFHNPDTGEEYNPNHPVQSGEAPDAEDIRPATYQEHVLYEAWQTALSQQGMVETCVYCANGVPIKLGQHFFKSGNSSMYSEPCTAAPQAQVTGALIERILASAKECENIKDSHRAHSASEVWAVLVRSRDALNMAARAIAGPFYSPRGNKNAK